MEHKVSKDLPAERLRALIHRSGLSQAEVSRRAGFGKPSSLQRHLESTQPHFHPRVVAKILPVLVGRGVPPITEAELSSLQYPSASPMPAPRVTSDVDMAKAEAVRLEDGLLGPIKVWASAAGGPEGAMVVDEDTPIERMPRPEAVRDVPDAFAVYLIGSSMEPRYEHGDRLVINPRRMPKPGDDALFLATAEDGTQHALVKRLVAIRANSWTVQQYSPVKEYELPKKVWQKAWLVVR